MKNLVNYLSDIDITGLDDYVLSTYLDDRYDSLNETTATPGNTTGMGNPKPPAADGEASEPLRTKKRKHKRKCSKCKNCEEE